MFADTSIQVRSLSNGYYAAYSAVFKHSIELLNLVDQNARIFVKFWRGSSSFFCPELLVFLNCSSRDSQGFTSVVVRPNGH